MIVDIKELKGESTSACLSEEQVSVTETDTEGYSSWRRAQLRGVQEDRGLRKAVGFAEQWVRNLRNHPPAKQYICYVSF